jgi:hypothetical protein
MPVSLKKQTFKKSCYSLTLIVYQLFDYLGLSFRVLSGFVSGPASNRKPDPARQESNPWPDAERGSNLDSSHFKIAN